MCENFQVRISKSPAKICPTRIAAWPEAAHMCWLYGSLQVLGIWIQLTLGGRVKQKFRNRIHLRLRLQFVGTEMLNLEVKGLSFLSRGKLVGDFALLILVNCYFLLKEPFPDTCVSFLHQIILTGLLETS